MNRYGQALLIMLLMVAATATPTLAQQGLYCATTGYNLNTGATTSSWRTAFKQLQRGSGVITFNGTSTVTSSGSFVGIVPPDAVPGAPGFFKTTGLHFVFGGRGHFYRVSAKASDSSITVLAGAAAPVQSGTTSEWWYWNTTSYRSATTESVFTDANTIVDRRLWETPSGIKAGFENGEAQYRPMASFMYRPAAGIVYASKLFVFWRPAGVPVIPALLYGINDITTTADNVSYPNTIWVAFLGAEMSDSLQSTASDNFVVNCIWRGRP